MALNLKGFVTPASEFEGLYKTADTLERKNYRDDQMRLREEARKEQAEGKRAASSRFFANYLDPKDRFTGTKFDPKVYQLLDEAKTQAYQLAKQGANDTDILAAINPLVAKTDQYVQTAKAINEQKKAALGILKDQKGIDAIKFSDEFDDEVFFETDPKTGQKRERDLSTIDPSNNYADLVLKNRNVYNNLGFDDFVAKAGKDTVVEDVSVYDRNKAMRRTKAEITKPSFMISEKDNRGAHIGFVPEFEIATEGDQPILHDFMKEQGMTEKAPVRMVTSEVFRSLPPNTKAYLRQEAIKYAKEEGIDPSSPSVENFAKALAYDELKRSAKQYSTLKELSVQKAAPIIINTGSGSSGVGEAKGNLIDKIDLAYYGSPQNGTIDSAEAKIIPADLQAVLKASGIDISGVDYFKLEIENGKVVAITPEGGKRIDRTAIANAQKKFNTEGQKQVQPDFETVTPTVKPPTPKPTKAEPYIWNGNTYSEQEITDEAKAQGLSKEAYMKKHGIKKN